MSTSVEVIFEAAVVVVQQFGPEIEVVIKTTTTVVAETAKVLAKL